MNAVALSFWGADAGVIWHVDYDWGAFIAISGLEWADASMCFGDFVELVDFGSANIFFLCIFVRMALVVLHGRVAR